MWMLFTLFLLLSIAAVVLFFRGKQYSPLWAFLAVWFGAIGLSQLFLSPLEAPWSVSFWVLLLASLGLYASGFFFFLWRAKKNGNFTLPVMHVERLRQVIYILFLLSAASLAFIALRLGSLPLISGDPDRFRFLLAKEIFGPVEYLAQAGRIFVPLTFFVFFREGFRFRRDWLLVLTAVVGVASLFLFSSRAPLFFASVLIMGLFLAVRRPDWKGILRFYPVFLVATFLILSLVPILRIGESYTDSYIEAVTKVEVRPEVTNPFLRKSFRLITPVYLGTAFNLQTLARATAFYEEQELTYGKASLLPITSSLRMESLVYVVPFEKIFVFWWDTGTYFLTFLADFGKTGMLLAALALGIVSAWVWLRWRTRGDFLSSMLLSYLLLFLAMSVYTSLSLRQEFYLDLGVIILGSFYVTRRH